MSFLDRLFGRGKSSGAQTDQFGMLYYVKCKKCGEVLRLRLDRRWDLQQEFEASGDVVSGYVATKEVMGTQCFNMMHVEITFDSGHREKNREVRGGEFVSIADYEAVAASRPNTTDSSTHSTR
jgi:hypothetical protein